MPSVFLVSDTHFGHLGVCKFTRNDGVTKLRPWDNPEEMDEEMVKRWNETVKPTDKVYHLGDVVINRKALGIMRRLNGDKVLIRGNHDIFRDEEYREHFRELRAYHVMDCGNSNCVICGNPRKTYKEKTIQEKRLEQNLDE